MTNLAASTATDSFEWDYLRCADLKYPVSTDFQMMHVYRSGEVILRDSTSAAIHVLCVQNGLKNSTEQAGSKDLGLLRDAGYLVEVQEDSAAFYAARTEYHNESSRRQVAFKQALFEREGLTGNPRAELCYSKAYERSYSKGLDEVANTFIDLAELIR
jgi:hypothetical protein